MSNIIRWSLAYYCNKRWNVFIVNANLSEESIERILFELNKTYYVAYRRIYSNGYIERDGHKTKKGEFIGLL